MLIDNRHGGPIHIPNIDGVLSPLPGVSEVANRSGSRDQAAKPEHKLPRTAGNSAYRVSVIDSKQWEESLLSIIPRIFPCELLLAPFLSHEDPGGP